MLGCRHGRVLVINRSRHEFLVYHPVSGDHRIVVVPPKFDGNSINVHGAVFCSAGDDQDKVHEDCHLIPFKVVVVGVGTRRDGGQAIARVYYSETGMWGDHVLTAEPCVSSSFVYLPCTLIGNALYWWLKGYEFEALLEFNLDSQSLVVTTRLPVLDLISGRMRIIRAEDGGVGVGVLSYPSFLMWDLKLDCHGVAAWVLRKTVNIQDIIGLSPWLDASMVFLAAYAEDADKSFISAREYSILFTVQLESMKVEKFPGTFTGYSYHPFTDFFTAGTVLACSTTPSFDPQQPS